MILSEVFRRLSIGELSNVAVGGDASGTLTAEGQTKALLHLNDGLRELFSKFILREKQLLLTTKTYITKYHLEPVHAFSMASDVNDEECYILDSVDNPFTGDVVRVLEAFDSGGAQYAMNDAGNALSLATPQGNVIQVPSPLCGQVFSLNYQAYHRRVDIEDGLDQVIDIPVVLEKALTSFIGHQIYANMVTKEAFFKAKDLQGKYLMIVGEAEEKDLLSTSRSNTGSKFQKNGWV